MPIRDAKYWARIRAWAKEAKSDGCTAVAEFHQECCFEHDRNCSGVTIDDEPITRAQADKRFRECIQERSKFGRFSPMSWWRWIGVRVGAWYNETTHKN